jgi:voltage-gated potassium channel Kch
MSGSHSPPPMHHDRPRYQWALLLLMTGAAMAFGGFGYYPAELAETHHRLTALSDVIYDSLQLFVLHTPHVAAANWMIEAAKWLAAAVSLWTVLGAFRRVYAMEWRRLRLGFSHNHVVICGAGWRGLPLARDFAQAGEKVVVVDRDPESPGIRGCQEHGVPYLVGDAADPRLLKAAGVHRARVLVASCDADETNLEIAIHARRLARALRREAEPLRCHVHLENPDLRTAVRRGGLIAETTDQVTLSTFGIDVYENSARLLFNQTPLDGEGIPEGSPVRPHLVILGLGDMGESVLIQAARIGQFANGRKLRATVIDWEADARAAELKARYPELHHACDLKFYTLEARDTAVEALLGILGREENHLPFLALCMPEAALNLALALKFAESRELAGTSFPIRVRVPLRSGLTRLLSEQRQHELFGSRIRPFGMREEVCNRRTLEQPETEALARSLHEDYRRKALAAGDTPANNPSLAPWGALSEDLKRSNHHAAGHFEVKMRAIGLRIVDAKAPGSPVTDLDPRDVETLSRMEHERFCAERFLGGWRHAPGRKDAVLKTNPTLVPWSELSERDRDKDRDQVKAIPRILAQAGLGLRRP